MPRGISSPQIVNVYISRGTLLINLIAKKEPSCPTGPDLLKTALALSSGALLRTISVRPTEE